MGTEKHSLASKKRWRKIPKEERRERMKALSNSAWGKLDEKARRRRALKAARTRSANRLKDNQV
jgi:hypothetical protein